MTGDRTPGVAITAWLTAGMTALGRGLAGSALRNAQRAAMIDPSASDPLALLYRTMRQHGTSGAAFRSLCWARVIRPRDGALLDKTLDLSARLHRYTVLARVADDIERFHGLDHALLASAADALLRSKDVGRAARLAKRAILGDPAVGDKAYRTLWQIWMGHASGQAAAAVGRWWVAAIGSDQSFRARCDLADRLGDTGNLVEAVCQALDRGFNPLNWQQRIAQLANHLVTAAEIDRRAVVRASGRIVSRPLFREMFLRASSKRPQTDAALANAIGAVQDQDLRDGLRALVSGEPDAAVRAYARFGETKTALSPAFENLVLEGPDAGHPLWHVANPYYRLWAEAASDDDAQGNWRTNPVFAEIDESDGERRYANWLAEEVPARRLLRSLIDRFDGKSVRVLDVGCGFGQWLRYLADHGGIPLENLFGLDLHASRVLATRETLRNAVARGAVCAGDPDTVVANTIQQRDLLQLEPEQYGDLAGFDIITLFVVTGCFDDEQLDQLIRRLAAMRPKFLFVTTVTRRWRLWHGRANEAEFFARHGFHETERHWTPEPFALDPVSALTLPRRYWTNLGVRLYQPG